jgi:hypothetical protein
VCQGADSSPDDPALKTLSFQKCGNSIRAVAFKSGIHMDCRNAVAYGNAPHPIPKKPQKAQAVAAPGDGHEDVITIADHLVTVDGLSYQPLYFFSRVAHS